MAIVCGVLFFCLFSFTTYVVNNLLPTLRICYKNNFVMITITGRFYRKAMGLYGMRLYTLGRKCRINALSVKAVKEEFK